MFEIILFILFILGNIYLDLFDFIYNFIIENNQLLINLLAIIFYALLNEDFDFDIENDDDDFDDNQDLKQDLDEHINDQDKKKSKK